MKQPYEELRKRHAWPDLQLWIDVEEQTSVIDVRSALQEKILSIADITGGVLSPEGYEQLLEAQVFSEDEHDRIRALHDRLSLLLKECLLAELQSTEEEEVALVKRLCDVLPELITEAKKIVIRSKEAYNGQGKSTSNLSYLG